MRDLGRILGVDYGRKRIGVAVSDPTCVIAQSLPTIDYSSLPEALNKIEEIIRKYEVSRIVVGFPLTMKGEVGSAAKRTNKFIRGLKDRFSVPISVLDERFTSVLAQRTIKDQGKSPSKNKSKIDEISAALILQSYLDMK